MASSWGLPWGWGTTTVASALPSAEGKELQAGGAGGGVPKFGAEPWRASQPSRLQQLRDAIPTTQGVREQLSKATIGVACSPSAAKQDVEEDDAAPDAAPGSRSDIEAGKEGPSHVKKPSQREASGPVQGPSPSSPAAPEAGKQKEATRSRRRGADVASSVGSTRRGAGDDDKPSRFRRLCMAAEEKKAEGGVKGRDESMHADSQSDKGWSRACRPSMPSCTTARKKEEGEEGEGKAPSSSSTSWGIPAMPSCTSSRKADGESTAEIAAAAASVATAATSKPQGDESVGTAAAPRACGMPSMPSMPGCSAPSMPSMPGCSAPSMPSMPGCSAPSMPPMPGCSAPSMPSAPSCGWSRKEDADAAETNSSGWMSSVSCTGVRGKQEASATEDGGKGEELQTVWGGPEGEPAAVLVPAVGAANGAAVEVKGTPSAWQRLSCTGARGEAGGIGVSEGSGGWRESVTCAGARERYAPSSCAGSRKVASPDDAAGDPETAAASAAMEAAPTDGGSKADKPSWWRPPFVKPTGDVTAPLAQAAAAVDSAQARGEAISASKSGEVPPASSEGGGGGLLKKAKAALSAPSCASSRRPGGTTRGAVKEVIIQLAEGTCGSVVSVSGEELSGDDVASLAAALHGSWGLAAGGGTSKVVKLYLGNNMLGDDEADALCALLKQSSPLMELRLHNNSIGSRGGSAIASNLQANTRLSILVLAHNRLGELAAASFGLTLRYNTFLTDLDLSGNPLGDTGIKLFADCLPSNSTLRNLHLASTGMGPSGAASLAAAISKGGGLRRVNLGSNQLGPRGFSELAACIPSPAVRITHMHLGNSGGGDAGATSIARALRANSGATPLASLYLQSNGIGDEGASELARSLGASDSLCELHLDGNNMSPNGVAMLASAAAASPSAIHSLPEPLCLALAMSLHPRLGAASPLQGLESKGLQGIVGMCAERVSRKLRVSGLGHVAHAPSNGGGAQL